MTKASMEQPNHQISREKLKQFNAEHIAPSRTSTWEAEVARMKHTSTSTSTEDDDKTRADCGFEVTSVSYILNAAAAPNLAETELDHTDAQYQYRLTKELSEWVIAEAREHYRYLSSQGDRSGAVKSLEDTLDKLQNLSNQSDDFVKLAQIDILLDIGRKKEAQDLLAACARNLHPNSSTVFQAGLESHNLSKGDLEWQESRAISFHKNLDLDQAELAKQILDRSIRAGAGKEADRAINSLRRTEPEYFNIKTQMESLFDKCRQISRLGAQKEAEADRDPTNAHQHLTSALTIYSQGCQEIEVSHVKYDSPYERVWRHDHDDCAHLFFAAARVCLAFKTLTLRGQDQLLMPEHLHVPHIVPQSNWELQALHFLELGRARALRDTLERNEKLDQEITLIESVPELQDDTMSEPASSSSTDQSPVAKPDLDITNFDKLQLSEDDAENLLDTATYKLAANDKFMSYKITSDRRSRAKEAIRSRLHTSIDLEEMQASIPAGTAVIEYALVSLPPSRGLIALIVTSTSVLIPEKVVYFNEEVQNLLDCLDYEIHAARYGDLAAKKSNLGYKQNGKTLLRKVRLKLVDPLVDLLAQSQRLIVVPPGELANVPWTLVFDKPVCVVPSLFVWSSLHIKTQRCPEQAPRTVFLASKPNDANGNAKNNQYARLEALSLAYFHRPGCDQRPWLADEMDLEELKNLFKDKELVHVCAHSTFNKTIPMGSSVELTIQPLTVWDWFDLSVRAYLVVFSSCLSAFSRTALSGQGFGFSYAMLSTGTDAFIGSLWRVNDKMTFLFMFIFYEHLLQGSHPADALFESQKRFKELDKKGLLEYVQLLRDMKADLSIKTTSEYVSEISRIIDGIEMISSEELKNPAHWAPFILVGHGFRSIGYPRIPLPCSR